MKTIFIFTISMILVAWGFSAVLDKQVEFARMFKTPISGISRLFDRSEEDYFPILSTGGRLVPDRTTLSATQLHIPHTLLRSKGIKGNDGRMTRIASVAVMLPDLEPAKVWQKRKGVELREQFPHILDGDTNLPKKKDMPVDLKVAYQAIVDEYQDKLLTIGLSAARDVYSVKWHYEGEKGVEVQRELAAKGLYHGPISETRLRPMLERSLYDGRKISFKVGKYGEGMWPHKRGGKLGRDFIAERGNPDHELWEYAEYTPVGATVANRFYYVPVVPETPHQLYITCLWNGNIDYLVGSKCSAESIYDETIRYSFGFKRTRLNDFHELNQIVKGVIESFIVEKSTFADLINKRRNRK